MKRLAGFLCLCLLVSSFASYSLTGDYNGNKDCVKKRDLFYKIENKIKTVYNEYGLRGDFLIAVVDEYGLKGYAVVNRNIMGGKYSDLSIDSPFYIASHTKAFTGALMQILEEEGMLDLNKSIADYLPELNFGNGINTADITLKNLLNHTHGIFSVRLTWKTAFLGYSGLNSEILEDLNNDFIYDPSYKFRYSNVGPIVAAIIAEKVTGKNWKELMREKIFMPLKMKNTSCNVSDYEADLIRPSVIVYRNNEIISSGFYKKDITMHASGGIISTTKDLSLWLAANIRQDEILMSKKSWRLLHSSSVSQNRKYFTYNRFGYSLGWDIAEYEGDTMLTRFGGYAGISCHISFIPKKKVGIIAFSTDNRAFLLPHLIANYVYNLMSERDEENLFENEVALFKEAFIKQNNLSYPPDSLLLQANNKNDAITGIYQTDSWPSVEIKKSGNHYNFIWGVLKGKIYLKDDSSFTTNTGVIIRDFKIKNDTLYTGSLAFIKE
ncbi:serine hydrolase domain-containing protein [Melioribacter sp. Ez-97]|uniref:serine hydrolase domain-containing protein n=1 Tax=Melioribacter sp. Ez-97 TaxID=3423434 RepID=UPI003ED83E6D